MLGEYRVSAFPVLDEEGGHRRRFRIRPVVQGSPGRGHRSTGRGVRERDYRGRPYVQAARRGDALRTRHQRRPAHVQRPVKRLPVVGANGELAGIVSRPTHPAIYSRRTRKSAGKSWKTRTLNGLCRPGPFWCDRFRWRRHPRGSPGDRGEGARDRGRDLARRGRRGRSRARRTYPEGAIRCTRTRHCPPGNWPSWPSLWWQRWSSGSSPSTDAARDPGGPDQAAAGSGPSAATDAGLRTPPRSVGGSGAAASGPAAA